MADGAVSYAETEGAGVGAEDTVGNGNVFADLLVLQKAVASADGDAVVAGVNDTVGNGYVSAGIDVDSVRIKHPYGVFNPDSPNLNKFAAVQEAAPAG